MQKQAQSIAAISEDNSVAQVFVNPAKLHYFDLDFSTLMIRYGLQNYYLANRENLGSSCIN